MMMTMTIIGEGAGAVPSIPPHSLSHVIRWHFTGLHHHHYHPHHQNQNRIKNIHLITYILIFYDFSTDTRIQT